MTIPHSKPFISENQVVLVNETIKGNLVGSGDIAQKFIEKFKGLFSVERCVGTPSCTVALFLAMKELGVKAGDEVVIPSYVCSDVMAAVVETGANPVLCDIGEGWNICPDNIRPVLNDATKVIIVPHLFGIPADIKGISKLGIPIIEDCAQAFGTSIKGEMTGTIGDYGVFSFNATKCLTTGEGGAVISRKNIISNNIFDKFSDLQASLGIVQLDSYPSFLQRRREIAGRYFDNIREEFTEKLQLYGEESIFFRFPLTVKGMNFERVKTQFAQKGISVRNGVDALLHRKIGLTDEDFPNTVKRFEQTLSIPIYPALSDKEVEMVIESVGKVLI